ncbi:hypothetical protein ACSVDE_13125 [Pseudalkalibacillus sp. Hm43]|uniref:hypothetical protein n=1 Tax=Pseudalkalibacillus sp. Hm43 TaxID=3450742 RepID=UPI003F41D7D5
MTAEVSILNRSGVALAADSAVTIGARKVYNSANKLFSLSKFHPVGIMIYGGASFMEIPWETIIKSFRSHLGMKKFDKLKTYQEEFIKYISSDDRLKNVNTERKVVGRTFSEVLNFVINKVQTIVEEELIQGRRIPEDQVKDHLENSVKNYLDHLRDTNHIILEINLDDFTREHSEVVESVIKEKVLFNIDSSTRVILMELAFEAVRRNYFTNGSSGLVISGYGEDELFPCLYEFKTDGFVLNTLKLEQQNGCEISIDNDKPSSAVIPFAQKEMVYSFMKGMDPVLQENIQNLIGDIFSKLPQIIQENTSVQFSSNEVSELSDLGMEIIRQIFHEISSFQNSQYSSPVVEIVDFLPKEEIAEMAEALVNLTSFKRRISIDTETVGGPIDVAVITKGDGFIWIKRKHYFSPNLNYGFFQNYLRGGKNDDSVNE